MRVETSKKLNPDIKTSALNTQMLVRLGRRARTSVAATATTAHVQPKTVMSRIVVAIVAAKAGVGPIVRNATGAKTKAKPAIAPTHNAMASVRAIRAAVVSKIIERELYVPCLRTH